ncbi:MAG: aminotransferase class III-fold pyridoxal phosphate-dependent enzyme, partial [Gammaproteobacteria bacterium]|nr:aminotransferase class III-fold pyridoxal phosphate-dependent enzyme [Gammaproteobacteria bacterium]
CAYHGNTTTIAELSPGDSGKETLEKWVETIPSPDTYRRTARSNDADWVQDYLDEVDLALERMRGRGVKPAALLLDCAFTSDGMFLPPQGLVTGSAARIRAAGGVLIADEVQSGFGRMGQAMWGFEVHGAEAEIVTLGKPIGNGHPLAATIMRHEILDAFTEHDHYFNTFGGNPVSAKVGLAVLDAFERDGLLRNSRETGIYLKECLDSLADSCECIGDVRSFGLIAGVELVSDHAAKTPAADMARRIVNNMRELRILISREGLYGNILKIRPPLPFGPANVDQLVDGLKQSVKLCL